MLAHGESVRSDVLRGGERLGLTVRLKVLDEVCAAGVVWSVAVTVNVVVASNAVGVPVI